ncbi:MAG: tail fiber domain-containing protein [Pseudonocardiaceae bacterium]
MTQSVNFQNGAELFNINLDAQGNLNFNANNTDGNGDRRLSIIDDSGQLTVGGGGQFGLLQLTSPTGGGTIFIGANQQEATVLLGGGNSGLNGTVQLGDSAGNTPIRLRGSDGLISCVDLTTASDVRLKKDIAPLLNALDRVIALRGVRYQWKHENHSGPESSEGSKIGFIGQEVASVCPELVATDAEGYISLNYSHLTAVLVEAIKEQHQLIQQQALALVEALQRIARIETALEAQNS